MKHSRLYKCAMLLFFVVLVISFSIEQADSRRRRRRVKCNTTARVAIIIKSDSRLSYHRTYTVNKNGWFAVRAGHCAYVGPKDEGEAQRIFTTWKSTHASDAKKYKNHLYNYPPGAGRGWTTYTITASCEGVETLLFDGELYTNSQKVLKLIKRRR